MKTLRLYLNDRTIVFHDVKVVGTENGIKVIDNPLTINIRPIKILGVCAFDDEGVIGRVVALPHFMWRMLRSSRRSRRRLDYTEKRRMSRPRQPSW